MNNTYEELQAEACRDGIEIVDNYPFESDKIHGLYCENTIAIGKGAKTNAEKACILAEELGHHYTTTGDILDQSKIANRQQEQKARTWAYFRQISLCDLVSAYRYGCRNQFEIADYLGVTEQFLTNALKRFKEKYGIYATCDNYVIYFEPLGVLEVYSLLNKGGSSYDD